MYKKLPDSRLVHVIIVTCLQALALFGARLLKTSPTSSTTRSATSAIKPMTSATPKASGILTIGTEVDAVNLGMLLLQTTIQDFINSKTCVANIRCYNSKEQIAAYLVDNLKITTKTTMVTTNNEFCFKTELRLVRKLVKWSLDRFFAAKHDELPVGSTTDVMDNYIVKSILP